GTKEKDPADRHCTKCAHRMSSLLEFRCYSQWCRQAHNHRPVSLPALLHQLGGRKLKNQHKWQESLEASPWKGAWIEPPGLSRRPSFSEADSATATRLHSSRGWRC